MSTFRQRVDERTKLSTITQRATTVEFPSHNKQESLCEVRHLCYE